MGLFGLLCTAITAGVFLTDSIKNSAFDANSKQDAINRGDDVWRDSHGNQYMVKTGQKVYTCGAKIYSAKTHEVIKDYFAENNEKAIQKAKAEGKKFARLRYGDKFYDTELSTMRPYELRSIRALRDAKYNTYTKVYISMGSAKTEFVPITAEEYIELGGWKENIYPIYRF